MGFRALATVGDPCRCNMCSLGFLTNIFPTKVLKLVCQWDAFRNTWGAECHKDLIVKPTDLSASQLQWDLYWFFSHIMASIMASSWVTSRSFCMLFCSTVFGVTQWHVVAFLHQIASWFGCPMIPVEVYKGKKANIDSYSAFFDNCKANDTGLTKQLEDAGVTDVYCCWVATLCEDSWILVRKTSDIPQALGCGLVFDICVKSSALHGAEMGFKVTVILAAVVASTFKYAPIWQTLGSKQSLPASGWGCLRRSKHVWDYQNKSPKGLMLTLGNLHPRWLKTLASP